MNVQQLDSQHLAAVIAMGGTYPSSAPIVQVVGFGIDPTGKANDPTIVFQAYAPAPVLGQQAGPVPAFLAVPSSATVAVTDGAIQMLDVVSFIKTYC